MFKSALLLVIAAASIGSAATFSGTTYTGKILEIGCEATSQNCKAKLELLITGSSAPAGCINGYEFMWYGRTPNGAVMTAMMTKAALKGKNFLINLDNAACFEGNTSYPTMTFYNIQD